MTQPRLLHIAPASYSIAVLLARRIELMQQQGFDNVGMSAIDDFTHQPAEQLAKFGGSYVESKWLSRNMQPLRDLAFSIEVFRTVRKQKPSVVLTYGPKPGYFARPAARIAGAKVIHTYWGDPFSEHDPKSVRTVAGVLDRISAIFAHRTLAVNHSLIDRVRSYHLVNKESVYFIGNGTDVHGQFAPQEHLDAERARLRETHHTGDRIVVLLVGRKVRDKGYGEFMEAAAELASEGLPVQFWTAGAEDKVRAGSAAELPDDLQSNHTMVDLGEMEHSEMAAVYAGADIVCLPSYREGFPRALVEAASVGRALVGSDIAGCREAIRPGLNGDLFPAADAPALTRTLRALIQDPDRIEEYGRQSRKRAEEEFSEDALVDRMLTHIAAVVD